MAKATKQPKRAAKPEAPDAGGWHDVPDGAPEALDLEVGEMIEGVMGPVRQGKYNAYRILTTAKASSRGSHEPGRYYLQGASLESLMQYPTGSAARIQFKGEVDTGQESPMRNYKKQVKPAASAPAARNGGEEDDLPFD